MIKELPFITCPICNQKYLPSEVFMPDYVFGKQYDIVKNNAGEIQFYLGDDPDLDEEFICDNCNTKLSVHMNMTFDIKPCEEENFEEEYSTKIERPKKIKLEENELF